MFAARLASSATSVMRVAKGKRGYTNTREPVKRPVGSRQNVPDVPVKKSSPSPTIEARSASPALHLQGVDDAATDACLPAMAPVVAASSFPRE